MGSRTICRNRLAFCQGTRPQGKAHMQPLAKPGAHLQAAQPAMTHSVQLSTHGRQNSYLHTTPGAACAAGVCVSSIAPERKPASEPWCLHNPKHPPMQKDPLCGPIIPTTMPPVLYILPPPLLNPLVPLVDAARSESACDRYFFGLTPCMMRLRLTPKVRSCCRQAAAASCRAVSLSAATCKHLIIKRGGWLYTPRHAHHHARQPNIDHCARSVLHWHVSSCSHHPPPLTRPVAETLVLSLLECSITVALKVAPMQLPAPPPPADTAMATGPGILSISICVHSIHTTRLNTCSHFAWRQVVALLAVA